ncbi:MAG: hypothetical protein ACRD3L_02135 [Terriglobales bacterium]
MKTEDTVPDPKDLRELARQIQEEMDPDKMIKLVQQLIAGFDEQQDCRNARVRGQDRTAARAGDNLHGSANSEGADSA